MKKLINIPVLLVVAILLVPLFGIKNSYSLEINLIFDPSGSGAVDPCVDELAACSGGVDKTPQLTEIVESVANYFESIIQDDHEIEMRYWWLDPSLGAPDALVLERDMDGKITKSRIRISSNLNYFYDETPNSDSEFLMRPKLIRTLHPDELTEAFVAGSAPEFYEIAFNGKEFSSQNLDLVTVVYHEMAHALGISNDVSTACDETDNPPFYNIDPDFDSIDEFQVKAYEFITIDDETMMEVVNFDCAHLALGGIDACKPPDQQDMSVGAIFDDPSTIEGLTVGECAAHQSLNWQGIYPKSRAKPSINDILVMQKGGGWELIDLPRIYSKESGNWSDSSIWLSGEVPSDDDEVFIVNQLPMFFVTEIEVDSNQFAKSVYLSDENLLTISENELKVFGPVTAAGPNSTTGPLRPIIDPMGEPPIGVEGPFTTIQVEPGGIFSAFDLIVEDGARFEITSNGEANLGKLLNDGIIRGNGIINVYFLDNKRIISADGGTLTFSIPETDPDDTLGIANPVLDIDGSGFFGDPLARINAIDGDLIFDGDIDDRVQADINIAEGRTITFTQGVHQGQALLLNPQHRITLDGGLIGATLSGDSLLEGLLEVNGIGIFTSDVVFSVAPVVDLDIGGVIPGSEHDQVQFSQNVTFAGTLSLQFVDGFTPSFQDEIVLATYANRIGEFAIVEGIDINVGLEGGIKLFLQYNDNDLTLFVGLDGGNPGEPNCNGQTVSEQAGIHGGMKNAATFHGFNSVKEFQNAIDEFCD